MLRRLALPLLILAACGAEKDQTTTRVERLAPPPEGEGFQVSLTGEAAPYSELWLCEVYPLPNVTFANVNRVDVVQNPGTHHTTLSALNLLKNVRVPYGTYNCEELYGDKGIMEDQVMIYGNQGNAEDTLTLPEGVVASLPPGLDAVHEVHYVNTTDQPVEVYSYVNAWTIPEEEVKDRVWGGNVRDENINIPPRGRHTEWSRCVMNEDVDVIFLASHMHQLGVEFTIRRFDGEDTGDVFYKNNDWQIPAITQYEEPIKLKAGEGFEWSCTWQNASDKPIDYGLSAQQEMCNLTIVHTPMSLTAQCEVVATSDGVLWSPDADE